MKRTVKINIDVNVKINIDKIKITDKREFENSYPQGQRSLDDSTSEPL